MSSLVFFFSCSVEEHNKTMSVYMGEVTFDHLLDSSNFIQLGHRNNSNSFVEKIDYFGIIDSFYYTVEYGSNRINQNMITVFDKKGLLLKKIDANDFLLTDIIYSTYCYGDNNTVNFVDPIRHKIFGINLDGDKAFERNIPENMRLCHIYNNDFICSPSMSSSYTAKPKYNFHRYDSHLNIVEQFCIIDENLWGIPLSKNRMFIDYGDMSRMFLIAYEDVEYRIYKIGPNGINQRRIEFNGRSVDKERFIDAVKKRNFSALKESKYIKDIFAVHEHEGQTWGFLLGSQSNRYIFKIVDDELWFKRIINADFMNDSFYRSTVFFRGVDGYIYMSLSQDAVYEFRHELGIDFNSLDNDLVFKFKIDYDSVF